MLARISVCVLTLCLSVLCFASSYQVDHVVAFGDSLTDNGRLYSFTDEHVPPAPFYEGRFSNGQIWVEYFVQDFLGSTDVLEDYAVGGAGAILTHSFTPFALSTELDDYLTEHQPLGDISSTLYVILIGANNYLGGSDISREDEGALVRDVVGTIVETAKYLISMGATKILLLGLPDLGSAPYFMQNPEYKEKVTRLTKLHNMLLRQRYLTLKKDNPEVNVVFFDSQSIFKLVKAHPSNYGVTNYTSACKNLDLFSPTSSSTDAVASQQGSSQSSLPSDDCSGYFFFDLVHPTTDIHRQIAERVVDAVKQAGMVAAGG